ncbi:hypothetical protein JMUB7546_26950 [Staphylococcus aureus]
MSASLVGSEMCIRDRTNKVALRLIMIMTLSVMFSVPCCLLYTSDAADD